MEDEAEVHSTYLADNDTPQRTRLALRSIFTCLRDTSALFCPGSTSCLAFAPSTCALIRAG